MHPSERLKYIKDISKELSKEEWALLDLTLKQFGLPWTDQWAGGDKEHYIIEMLSNAANEPLLELAKHIGVASQLDTSSEPTFWNGDNARVFLSHLAQHKVITSNLRDSLITFGITAFVAHEDIEPTKAWQTEIETALSTMDALVALLHPGFKESNWCDQEVGVAIGRKVPIVSVRLGLDPYGFIGKYQALQGSGKTESQLAEEIFDLLIPMPGIGPKITNGLVGQLKVSPSFKRSQSLMAQISKSKYLTSKHCAAMKEAVKNNFQVSESWGVPQTIERLAAQNES